MNFTDPTILPLGERWFGMLQVLLPEFTLTKESTGLLLELDIHDGLNSLVDAAGKRAVFRQMGVGGGRARDALRAELEEFFQKSRLRSCSFQTEDCPLRYGNGGALPVVRIGSETYFCLFYRDAFPVGWNLANGASDSVEEMGEPQRILHREFGEELLIVDHEEKRLYVFDTQASNGPRGVQAVSLREWGKQCVGGPLDQYEYRPTPLKWFFGPDRVIVRVRGERHSSDGYFVNVTPEDNAIECDRIALVNLKGSPVFFDGELMERQRLNRPVGLFKATSFEGRLDCRSFRPDLLFHDLSKKDPADLERVVAEYRMRVPEHSEDNVRAYKEAADRNLDFDLCPITRAMIRRYQQWMQRQKVVVEESTPRRDAPAAMEKCEIFISYHSVDETIARCLFDFLERRGRRGRVFLGSESLPRLGESDFASTIQGALDSATLMIVIGTRPEHFDSGWVGAEWRAFFNEIHSKRKAKGQLFVFAGGVEVGQLPLFLRSHQIIPYSAASPHDSFEALYRFVESAVPALSI